MNSAPGSTTHAPAVTATAASERRKKESEVAARNKEIEVAVSEWGRVWVERGAREMRRQESEVAASEWGRVWAEQGAWEMQSQDMERRVH